MACYNRMKRADRERELADRKAEIAAVDAGKWPRNLDDEFRWGVNQRLDSIAGKAAHARRMCLNDVNYLEGVPGRIKAGELPGWEA